MPAIDDLLYLTGATPSKGSYLVELDGQRYKALRTVTFPEHKMERKTLVGAGGRKAFAHTAGVLNADAEGTFKLLPASANFFRTYLIAKSLGLAEFTAVPFTLRAYSLNPLTQDVAHLHVSLTCVLTAMKEDDIGEGSDEVGCTFSYRSLDEVLDGVKVSG